MTRLTRWINMATVTALPDWSTGPTGSPSEVAARIHAAGYDGVQIFRHADVAPLRDEGLRIAALARVATVDELRSHAAEWEHAGAESLTVHYGTGFESPAEGHAAIAALVELDEELSIDLLLETHRATLTQDPARTLQFVESFPSLRFTADLAQWYVGVQMIYGGFEWKVDALRPVFDRTRFVHGRMASPSQDQVSVETDRDTAHFEHFSHMWRSLFAAVVTTGDVEELAFAPELLPGRPLPSDRWQEAAALCDLADELFAEVNAADTPEG